MSERRSEGVGGEGRKKKKKKNSSLCLLAELVLLDQYDENQAQALKEISSSHLIDEKIRFPHSPVSAVSGSYLHKGEDDDAAARGMIYPVSVLSGRAQRGTQ